MNLGFDNKQELDGKTLHLHKEESGWFGFININNFLKGLKCAWVKRYACVAKDHWADLLDRIFGATPESRATLTMMVD